MVIMGFTHEVVQVDQTRYYGFGNCDKEEGKF